MRSCRSRISSVSVAVALQGRDSRRLLCRAFANVRKPAFLPLVSEGRRPEAGRGQCEEDFIHTRQATANTSSIITSFRLEKPVRRQVCERLRTGPSKPISSKTIPISHFTRASTTTVMKATSVAMANTLPVMSIHRRERNSGGSGNLNIPATPAYLIGSCACQRTLFGVMEDCGATTPSQCWAPFFASNSRWQVAKWQLPSRLRRREARIYSS